MRLFSDLESVKVLEQFSADIKDIGTKIDERNEKWNLPYKYLHPSRVACRIDY